MFSKHKNRFHNSSNHNNHNNLKKKIEINLDEKGKQDSLRAAQIIFQRHNELTNGNNTPQRNEEIPKSKSPMPLYNNSKPTNSNSIYKTYNNNNSNNNIPSNSTTPQQRHSQAYNEEAVKTSLRRTSPKMTSTQQRQKTRLLQPSPLPLTLRTKKIPSPNVHSTEIFSQHSNADYLNLENNPQNRDLHYLDTDNHDNSLMMPEPYILKKDNSVANIAAALAQSHINGNSDSDRSLYSYSQLYETGIPTSKPRFKQTKASENNNNKLTDNNVSSITNDASGRLPKRQENFNNDNKLDDIGHVSISETQSYDNSNGPIKINERCSPESKKVQSTTHLQIDSQLPRQEDEPRINQMHHRIPPPVILKTQLSPNNNSISRNSLIDMTSASSLSDLESDENGNSRWESCTNFSDYLQHSDMETHDTNENAQTRNNDNKNNAYDDDDENFNYSSSYGHPSVSVPSLNITPAPESASMQFPDFSDDDDEDDNDDDDNDKNHNGRKKRQSKRKKVKTLGKLFTSTTKKAIPIEPFGKYSSRRQRSNRNTNGPVRLKETMRSDTKKAFNEDKPWKKHRDVKFIDESDRKRYEGVWVSNRYSYLNLLPWWPQESHEKRKISDDFDTGDSSITDDTNSDDFLLDLPEDGLILNIVVKAIWERSNLPNELLIQIYNLIDTRKDGTLNRKSFIVGMWLVDQCLYGRKLPDEVSPVVWDSVDRYTMNVIQSKAENESYQKRRERRKLMRRELKHIKSGIKHVHL